MTQVTKEQFFTALNSEENKGKDIMPHIDNEYIYPFTSTWKEKRSREIFGKTTDGTTLKPTKYFLNI